MRDNIFDQESTSLESFQFSSEVAQVFDDMVVRSVPHYSIIQALIVQLALRCAAGRPIYDLGCSTGTTILRLIEQSKSPLRLYGIDSSDAMLDICRQKTSGHSGRHLVELSKQDLEDWPGPSLGSVGAFILCLTLQFIRPLRRQALLNQLHQQLGSGGCVLLVEKTVQEQPDLNNMFIDLYHEMKRQNGYSEIEITRKRQALENRLIPFRTRENMDMLRTAGFTHPSIFFTVLNFQGYIGVKAGG